jgi:hypothetical protein
MSCPRREYTSPLTEKLKGRQITTVEAMLVEPSLPVTARNDAQALADFLAQDDPQHAQHTQLQTLVEWALTDRLNGPTILDTFKRNQLNRNAAAYLSSPSQRLPEVFSRDSGAVLTVLGFLDSKYATDPGFAGNFQRIFEQLLRWGIEAFTDPTYVATVVDFAIDHIHIAAYHDLLVHLATDFASLLRVPGSAGDPVGDFVLKILRAAACHVFVLESERANHPATYRHFLDVVKRIEVGFGPPVRRDQSPYPEIEFTRVNGRSLPALAADDGYQQRLRARKEEVGFNLKESYEDAQLRAYVLLSTIASMGKGNPAVYDPARRPEYLGRVLRLLLMCGIYADPDSLVAPTAFRIAGMLVYGDDPFQHVFEFGYQGFGRPSPSSPGASLGGMESGSSDGGGHWLEPVPGPRLDRFFGDEVTAVVADFAQDFAFGLPLTGQMRAALGLFWNHRYADLFDGMPVYRPIVDVDDHTWTRGPGLTPLELCCRLLLQENPPGDDGIARGVLGVLFMLDEWHFELQKRVTDEDALLELSTPKAHIFVEVLRTKFKWRIGSTASITDMKTLIDHFPLIWHSPYFIEKGNGRHRVPLNGAIVVLARFITETDLFVFPESQSPLWDNRAEFTSPELVALLRTAPPNPASRSKTPFPSYFTSLIGDRAAYRIEEQNPESVRESLNRVLTNLEQVETP